MLITDNDYCQAILINQNMDFSSIEKFFLIRIVCSFGATGEVLATVGALEERLYLSEAVLKRTRNSLLKKDYLTYLPDPVNSGGRPRKCFKITTRCLELLQTCVLDEEPCNQQWIEELLFNDVLTEISVPDRSGKTRRIRPPVRILMGILLAHSSDVGLVSGLGHADLRRLIGSSLDCLKSQMATLHEIGFILTSRSGFTHKATRKLFKGQYALNFGWVGFSDVVSLEQLVSCRGSNEASKMSGVHRDVVLNLEYTLLMNQFGKQAKIPPLQLGKLMAKIDQHMKRYLSWVIFESACNPSRGWVEIDKLIEHPKDQLGQKFRDQVRAKVVCVFDEKTNKEDFDFIFNFVCFYAIKLTNKIVMILDAVFTGDRRDVRCLVTPSDYNPIARGFDVYIFNGNKKSSSFDIKTVVECGSTSKIMKLIADVK